MTPLHPQPLLGGPVLDSFAEGTPGEERSVPVFPGHGSGFFHPPWEPAALIYAGHIQPLPFFMTYTFTGKAAAGELVVLDIFTPEPGGGAGSVKPIENPASVGPSEGFLGKPSGEDSKGNYYYAWLSAFYRSGEGVVKPMVGAARVICVVAHAIEPGDTVELYVGPVEIPEEEAFSLAQWSELQERWEHKESPFKPGEALYGWNPEEIKQVKVVITTLGFPAFAVAFAGSSSSASIFNTDAIYASSPPGGSGSLLLEDPQPGMFVSGRWDTAASPAGGAWLNLLNSSTHGEHRIADFRRLAHSGQTWVGVGPGHVSGVNFPQVFPEKEEDKAPETLTTELVPDETLGKSEGPLEKPGKRLTIVAASAGPAFIDLGHMATGIRSDTGAALFAYYGWPGGTIVGAEAGGQIAEAIFQRWEEAFTRDRNPMPRLVDVAVRFQVTGHTAPRYSDYAGAGEDGYAGAKFTLEERVGDLYEGGVLVAKGVPLICGDALTGVEFRLREELTEFNRNEWKANLAETLGGIQTYGATTFNTLTFTWEFEVNIYFPPSKEPPAFAVNQPQVATLTKTVTPFKEPPSEEETPQPPERETVAEEEEKRAKGEETQSERESKLEGEARGEFGKTQVLAAAGAVVRRDRQPYER